MQRRARGRRKGWGTEGLVVSPKGFPTLTRGSPEPRATQAAVPSGLGLLAFTGPLLLQWQIPTASARAQSRPGTPGTPCPWVFVQTIATAWKSLPQTPRD